MSYFDREKNPYGINKNSHCFALMNPYCGFFLEDESDENLLDEIEASLGRDRDYFPTWASGGCDEDEE